jgi:hypothetical protein
MGDTDACALGWRGEESERHTQAQCVATKRECGLQTQAQPSEVNMKGRCTQSQRNAADKESRVHTQVQRDVREGLTYCWNVVVGMAQMAGGEQGGVSLTSDSANQMNVLCCTDVGLAEP